LQGRWSDHLWHSSAIAGRGGDLTTMTDETRPDRRDPVTTG
jgi:hypothetical protein